MMSRRFLCWACAASLFLVAPTCVYAKAYEEKNLENFIKTMIRFGAVDVRDDALIDMYARANACDVYAELYSNEFKWKEMRDKLRAYIKANMATYPTGYYYDAVIRLGRYDFEKKYYPFEKNLAEPGVNSFTITDPNDSRCGKDKAEQDVLKTFRFILNEPLQIRGLPLTEAEGKLLFERMNAGEVDHVVYARFNLRVVFIAPLEIKEERQPGTGKKNAPPIISIRVSQGKRSEGTVFDSRLDSIEFYEDKERTKLAFIYRP